MSKIYDVPDFELCMISNVRMFRRSKDFELFENLKQVFCKYLKYLSNNTLVCSLRDLQPHSIEGEDFDDSEWEKVLPFHDFLLTVLISRELQNGTEKSCTWVASDVATQAGCICGRFKNQLECEAWAEKQCFDIKFPYKEADSFNIEETDIDFFNTLLLNMLKYSAPRYTYMPSVANDLIVSNIDLIADETKEKMITVIDDALKSFESAGSGIGGGPDPCIFLLRNKLQEVSQ